MANYLISQKSRRWWLKLFYYMIDTAVINSFILYKESCNTISQLEFRSKLTDELIINFSSRKKQTSSPQDRIKKKKILPLVHHYSFDNVQHLPKCIDKYKHCKMYSIKKKEKRSNIVPMHNL